MHQDCRIVVMLELKKGVNQAQQPKYTYSIKLYYQGPTIPYHRFLDIQNLKYMMILTP